MEFSPASLGSVMAFVGIVLGCCGAATWATFFAARAEAGEVAARAATRRFVMGLGLWVGGFSAIVASGAPLARPMPLFPLLFAGVFLGAIGYGCSAAGGRLARQVPVRALVAFLGFRLPLELVLHRWAQEGTIPVEMTWDGQNFDVVAGAAALVLAPFAHRRAVAWGINVVGALLLINVARVVAMSSPLPFGWPVQPKLLLVGYLPYAWIGPVCVAAAIAGHVVLTRKLLQAPPARA